MAKYHYDTGSTNVLWHVFLPDSTSTTGAGKTGLHNASTNLVWSYLRAGSNSTVQISVVNANLGEFASGGIKEISAANMPGMYEFGPPDAMFASGANSVVSFIKADGIAPTPIEVQMRAVPSSATISGTVDANVVSWNGNAVVNGTNGLPIVDAANSVWDHNISLYNNVAVAGGSLYKLGAKTDSFFYRALLIQYVSIYEITDLAVSVTGSNLSDVELQIMYANATTDDLSLVDLGKWTQAGGFVKDAGWTGQTYEGPIVVYVNPQAGFTGNFTGATLAFTFTFDTGHAASSPVALTLTIPSIPYLVAGETWPCWWLRDKTPLQGWVPWVEYAGANLAPNQNAVTVGNISNVVIARPDTANFTYASNRINTVEWVAANVTQKYNYDGTNLANVTVI